jgi:FliI/YscN family ATPase
VQLAPTDLPLYYGRCDGFVRRGRVIAVSPSSVRVSLPAVSGRAVVALERGDGSVALAEVVTAERGVASCRPLDSMQGVVVGAPATATGAELGARVGPALLGDVVDAWGRSRTDRGAGHFVARHHEVQIEERRPIDRALATGVAGIDALCTIGAGQRVGLYAGAGVGKSTLLRCIAQHVTCDAHVLALVGERAREASETIDALRQGPRWPATTVVCSTAAAPPFERFAAVRAAHAQAEWLCEQGCDVLLTVDSLTRVAVAWRELALAAGEQPAHRGHPPSLVSALASIVENAGARQRGSITAIYSVLVDGDDPFEPVSDALRGLLDGHIMLARRLADAGRFPAIDVLRSSSRLMPRLATPRQSEDASLLRRALATLEDSADLLAIGAYKPGGDPWLDAALELRAELDAWLFHGSACAPDAVDGLARIARDLRSAYGRHAMQA